MSIEKIKEFKSKIDDPMNKYAEWHQTMLIVAIADCLIEQEEQKEPGVEYVSPLNTNLFKFSKKEHEEAMAFINESCGASDTVLVNDPVVEVGQMFIVENGDLKPLGIFTQEDLDKAREEGRFIGYNEALKESIRDIRDLANKIEGN